MPLSADEQAIRREVERETKASRNRYWRQHPRLRGQKQTSPNTKRKDQEAMQITTIHVDFKATVSDGNYGNESYSVAFTATLDPNELPTTVVGALAHAARGHVYAQLKESPREGIRHALETPEEREARWAQEREEHLRQKAARAAAHQAAEDEADESDDDDGPAF